MLDIIRGGHSIRGGESDFAERKVRPIMPTRVFALQGQHFASLQPSYYNGKYDTPLSPTDFHSILCERIQKASRRIYLASLYVGPAVDPHAYRQEGQLLCSLGKATAQNQNLNIKILLDKSRGLRPVPIPNSEESDTITSAEACQQALLGRFNGQAKLQGKRNPKGEEEWPAAHGAVYLHSVLSPLWQKILPNPLDEVAGVFHIKVYIIDDELILSGANLSQEYFTDRHDRYLHIIKGGNGLVDWYAELVDVLCEYSEKYRGKDVPLERGKPKKHLINAVKELLEARPGDQMEFNLEDMKDGIVAMACPSFQAPKHYGAHYRSDTNMVVDLLTRTSDKENEHRPKFGLRLASAYLNLTSLFQKACQSVDYLHCLTAGYISHGFRPKKKAGNKGKTWIPAVFDTLARQTAKQDGVNVWYYTRPDWTYHAKGLWLSCMPNTSNELNQCDARFSAQEDLVCVTHGSGNNGERSQFRDMESNLFLVLPPGSPLIEQHKAEWNTMCEYAITADKGEVQELKWYFRLLLPWIKRYF